MTRYWLLILGAVVMTIPAVAVRIGGAHTLPLGFEALTFGVAILGGAFLLTWAAEVAELDISQGLALSFLALVAVLPEYAVDLYFASKAATQPEYTAYATANMTGANRLLIGIAWPLIVVLYWARSGRHELKLPGSRAVELVFLSLATIYAFAIPLKGTLSLLDTVVLVVFFVFAAGVIVSSAEPFAEALVHLGRRHGIDEFLLVQWLAPLASEAPEVVIACILTLKGDAQAGMGAMVSSKVNQWTLLVGTLPLVYSIALGHPGALHLDARQVEEILLTSAQSLFAVAVLSNLRLSLFEAAVLVLLFVPQLFFPSTDVRYGFALAYCALAGAMLVRQRNELSTFLRAGLGVHRRRHR
jgi:cation:H+ antiporter